MKTLFISDISDGQQVQGQFLVKSMSRLETKAGKPYLNLTLMDNSGDIVGRVWDQADKWQGLCSQGAVVEVTAQCQSFRGTLQLNIGSVAQVDEGQVDMADFVPASEHDPDEMAAELVGLIRKLDNPFIRKLLLKFFNDEQFMAVYKKAPAAKAMHHAYVGGLLEHTLGVSRLASATCALYPQLDLSLLTAGALLHDIGKMEEFDFSSYPADYSDKGRLMGHMVIGCEMVEEKIRRIKDFPEELAVRIKHLILSHHGRHDFGSPTLPMLSEGFVLNFLDDLDAKLNTIEGVRAKMKEPGYQWSDYQRSLERFLFVKGHSEEEKEGPQTEEPPRPTEQPRLF